MTPIWRVSDEEVWTAIRYLDPDDDHHSSGKHDVLSSRRRYVRWIKAGVLLVALFLTLYVAGKKYLATAYVSSDSEQHE